MKPSAFRNSAAIFVGIILTLEALGMAAITAFLAIEVLTENPDSYASAIGLIVLAVLALIWISATTIAFVQGKASARGSALVWQVLQGALGIASNQGLFARPDVGSALLLPAIAVVAMLLFSKNINKHLGVSED
jgi:hypothetical protein